MYRISETIENYATVYHGKVVICLVLVLSVLTNSLFSLGYIILACFLTYKNKHFLKPDKARKKLVPIFEKVILRYMIFEILIHLVFQIPIDAFEYSDTDSNLFPKILGLYKHYKMVPVENGVSTVELNVYRTITHLLPKALVYFLISM